MQLLQSDNHVCMYTAVVNQPDARVQAVYRIVRVNDTKTTLKITAK